MPKKVKQLPEEFKTLEEAVEFWDTHDSTEFMEVLEEVDVKVDLQKRHYLVELDKNIAETLEGRAEEKELIPGILHLNLFMNSLLKLRSFA